MPRLENWSLVHNYHPYLAPECLVVRLHGQLATAHADESLKTGKNVVTSNVVCFDLKGNKAVTKSGTVYDLGKPCEDWLKGLNKESLELGMKYANQDQEDVVIPKL